MRIQKFEIDSISFDITNVSMSLVCIFRHQNDGADVIKAEFAKYNVSVSPSLRNNYGAYESYKITLTSWSDILVGTAISLFSLFSEEEPSLRSVNLQEVCDNFKAAMEVSGSQIASFRFQLLCLSLHEKLFADYSDLLKVRNKLIMVYKLLDSAGETNLPKMEIFSVSASDSLIETVQGIAPLIQANNKLYSIIQDVLRKFHGRYLEQVEVAAILAKKSNLNLSGAGDYVDEKQIDTVTCSRLYNSNVSLRSITEFVKEIVKLRENFEEISVFIGGRTVSKEEKLIHQFSLQPSPIVTVIHSNLSEEEKLSLIRVLAKQASNSETGSNIHVADYAPDRWDGRKKRHFHKYKRLPFLHAVEFGGIAIVQLLIDLEADIHAHAEGQLYHCHYDSVVKQRTALHIAAIRGDSKILNLLLQNGLNVNHQDDSGCTALHLAENSACVEALLQHGANTNIVDHEGNLPLHVHIITMREKLVSYCDAHGWNMAEQRQQEYGNAINLLIKATRDDINSPNKSKLTPLHLAFAHGGEIIRALCENGADINSSANPIFMRIIDEKGYRDGQVELLKVLINYALDLFIVDARGYTILHYAIEKGNHNIINYLLTEFPQRSQLVNFQAAKNVPTPLHLAIRQYCKSFGGFLDVIKLLLSADADPTAIMIDVNEELTPLQYGVKKWFKYESLASAAANVEQLANDNEMLMLVKKSAKEKYEEHQRELAVELDGLKNLYFNFREDLRVQAQTEKENIDFNEKLNAIIDSLILLSKKFSPAYHTLQDAYLFVLELKLFELESRNQIPEVIEFLKLAFEAGNVAESANSIASTKLENLRLEIHCKCLTFKSTDKETNIATSIACLLACQRVVNQENLEDVKGLLIELMGLKLDGKQLSLDELKQKYPAKYQNAWATVNKQSVELFYKGDSFTDKKFIKWSHYTKNKGVIERKINNKDDNNQHEKIKSLPIWHRSLPKTDVFCAEDDSRRQRFYDVSLSIIKNQLG